ncbi:MAG TPA: VOC family protein [Blastocatellia bacterium]|nr:VOC family protein [Blastocatellia bacterium]
MPLTANPSFHHIEIPCYDLEVAERFYTALFGATVYMRRDANHRTGVPATGSIAQARASGFEIDATYMKFAGFRIGFLKRRQQHAQQEVDHLAFVIDDDDLAALARRLEDESVDVVEYSAERMLVRDPFGLILELWPRSVLRGMGLL